MIWEITTLQKILIVNIAMLKKTYYYDHGTSMNINKSKRPMGVKHCREFFL
jgi:hypothetical protein